MPKRKAKKDRENNQNMGSAWMVVGLFIGWLIGVVPGLIYGPVFFWMAGGAISGWLIGAVADYIHCRHK